VQDEDPYVRKTAAINVVKLFDHEVDLVRDEGYLDRLREMLTDAVPMVRRRPESKGWATRAARRLTAVVAMSARVARWAGRGQRHGGPD